MAGGSGHISVKILQCNDFTGVPPASSHTLLVMAHPPPIMSAQSPPFSSHWIFSIISGMVMLARKIDARIAITINTTNEFLKSSSPIKHLAGYTLFTLEGKGC